MHRREKKAAHRAARLLQEIEMEFPSVKYEYDSRVIEQQVTKILLDMEIEIFGQDWLTENKNQHRFETGFVTGTQFITFLHDMQIDSDRIESGEVFPPQRARPMTFTFGREPTQKEFDPVPGKELPFEKCLGKQAYSQLAVADKIKTSVREEKTSGHKESEAVQNLPKGTRREISWRDGRPTQVRRVRGRRTR